MDWPPFEASIVAVPMTTMMYYIIIGERQKRKVGREGTEGRDGRTKDADEVRGEDGRDRGGGLGRSQQAQQAGRGYKASGLLDATGPR